jgi:hypothetical protein
MPRAPVEFGTSLICGTHGKLSAPAWHKGEKRMRHATAGDRDWCRSERFTRRVVDEVDRETALAALTGEDEEP